MDILIYAKPEKVEHKLFSNVEPGIEYCYWTGRIPSLSNMYNIKKVYFSDGNKIYVSGVFFGGFSEETGNLCFSLLRKINLKQPKKPPIRGWCYINK